MTAGALQAEHRTTVLLHLAALADRRGPQQVTAADMAAEHRELDEQDWLGVLQSMARLGHAGETERLLYRVDGTDAYALAMAGHRSAKRLTAGERVA